MIIGAQLYTVRNQCDTLENLENTLKAVADIGYKAVQLSGICAYEADWMKKTLDKYGLVAPITHTPYRRIVDDTEKVIADHKAMGAEYVGLGSLPNLWQSHADPGTVDRHFDELAPAIEKIHDAGLMFSYHNHSVEFAKDETGRVLLDRIADKAPADRLALTLDCYWVTAGGGDPAWWLRHLTGRIPCIHFKDMVFNGEDMAVRMAPVGEGNLNYPEIIRAAEEAGVRYAFVEQDECYELDPIEALRVSYDRLRGLGL